MKLQEFRKLYPEYDKWSDSELADGLYSKYYSTKFDRQAFNELIGFEGVPPSPRNLQEPAPADQSMPPVQTPGDQLNPQDYLAMETPAEPAAPLMAAHAPTQFKYLDKFVETPTTLLPSHADPRTERLKGYDQALQERMKGYSPEAGAGGAGAIATLITSPPAMIAGGIAAGLRLIAEQDLDAANQTLEEVMAQPAKLLYRKVKDPVTGQEGYEARNPEDVRLTGEAMKPFELLNKAATAAGDWAEQAAGESEQAADIGATTATIVEAGLLFGLPKLAGAIGKAPWVRRLTNRERALMVQDIADMKKSGMTEGQIIREFKKKGNDKPFQDALKARKTPEQASPTTPAPKPEGKGKAAAEIVEPAASQEVVAKPVKTKKPEIAETAKIEAPAKLEEPATVAKVKPEPAPTNRLPEPETGKQHLQRIEREYKARKKKAFGMAKQAGKKPVVLTQRGTNKRGVIIHKSTKKKDHYQITYWDDKGFSGDTQAATLEKAIDEALTEGYETINPAAFNKAVSSRRFAGYTKAAELHKKIWYGSEKGEGVIEMPGPEPAPKPEDSKKYFEKILEIIKGKHKDADADMLKIEGWSHGNDNLNAMADQLMTRSESKALDPKFKIKLQFWARKLKKWALAPEAERKEIKSILGVDRPKVAKPAPVEPAPEPKIEITGKEKKTVTVDMPKSEAKQLSVKEQRFYLEKEINAAIKAAPKDGYSKGFVTFKVPGDGEFTIVNQRSVLAEFKKSVFKTLPKSGKFPGRPVAAGLKGKGPMPSRISGEGVAYYNEYKPKSKKPLIENDRQWYDNGWHITGSYFIKSIDRKGKKPYLDGPVPNYKEIIKSKTMPAKIVAVTHAGKPEIRPGVHIKALAGDKQVLVNADFVDNVLSHYPDAKPHIVRENTPLVLWKSKRKVVAATAPLDVDEKFFKGLPQKMGEPYHPKDWKPEPTTGADTYMDDKGRYVRVGQAPQGNYSFYATKDLKNQGERVRMARSGKRFWDTMEEAQAALKDYAAARGWKTHGTYKAPSGHASAGIFNEAAFEGPGGAQYVENIPFVMQMPELVALAKELLGGRLPRVAAHISRNPGVRGYFMPGGAGLIKLRADIMQNPKQAIATLAHEIGHLVDYLPDKTMARGNLLGRMASLKRHARKFLPHKPGAPGELTDADRKRLRQEAIKLIEGTVEKAPADLTAKDVLAIWQDATGNIRKEFPELYNYIAGLGTAEKKSIVKAAMKGLVADELKAITKKAPSNKLKDVERKLKDLIKDEIKKRKLFSEEDLRKELIEWTHFWKPFDQYANPKYTRYRYSGVELYADFYSGLMLAPATVKRYAPKAYEAFFNYLENKPKLMEEYDRIQDLIKSGEVMGQRVQDLRKMFRKGDRTWAKQYEARAKFSDLLMREFVEQHHFLYKKIKKIGEKNIPAGDNPRYRIEQMQYSGSEHEYHMRQVFQKIIKPLEKAGADWQDFREYVFHLRVANERHEMFNPLGHTKETSAPRIAEIEASPIGEALKKARQEFRKIHLDVIDKAEKAGIWNKELIDMMREREFYARWLVQEYVEKKNGRGPGAKVYKQYGTLSEIFDPATATIMQDLAVIKATNRSIAAKTTVKFLKDNFPDEIQAAETRWVTNHREAIIPSNPDLGQIMYLDNGRVKTYNVDKFIAQSFEQNPVQAMAIAKVFQAMAKPFRVAFTEINYGFWMFNLHRDYFRAAKNLPGAKVFTFAKYYFKGIKPAFKSAFGVPDDVIAQMAKNNMLISIADIRGMRTEDMQIERLLKQFHMRPREWNNRITRPFGKAFTYFSNIGRAFERVPKVGGYLYLRKKFPDMTSHEIGHIVRTQAGSPDFLRAGRAYPIYNNLLLFSNAAKEGYRGDYESFAKTPGAYMWKTIKYHWIPKLLQWAATTGLLGAGLKQIMDGVSEYDKTNYIIIPLGMVRVDPKTGTDEYLALTEAEKSKGLYKSVYWRVPVDETGRFLGGLLWKMLNVKEFGFTDSATGLFDYMAGQAPTINPGVEAVWDVVAYASGRNPYDSFRGRYALPETVHEAGGKRAHLAMARYLANKMGAGIVYNFRSSNIDKIKTELETALGLPVSSNLLGRFLKVTDYGVREDIKRAKKRAKTKRQRELLDAREAMYKLVNQEELTKENTKALLNRPGILSEENLIIGLARRHGYMYLEEFLAAGSKDEQDAVIKLMIEKHGKAD
jgi:hypothetical protein